MKIAAVPFRFDTVFGLSQKPIFIRRVARPIQWQTALDTNDPKVVEDYLHDGDGSVSMWRIADDEDLRLVAVGIDATRGLHASSLLFLTILPDDLAQAGIKVSQSSGDTGCPPADRLHYDAEIDPANPLMGERLLRLLIAAQRRLGRCTEGQVKAEIASANKKGCFAVNESSASCGCGEIRATP